MFICLVPNLVLYVHNLIVAFGLVLAFFVSNLVFFARDLFFALDFVLSCFRSAWRTAE